MRVPQNYWKDKSNQLAALKQLEAKLDIKEPTDWYNLKYDIVIKVDENNLIKQFDSSLSKMLISLRPEIQWETTK